MKENNFVTEFESINRALDDPSLTAEGFVRSILAEIAALKFTAPGSAETLRAELQAFEKAVRDYRSRDAAFDLRREAGLLLRRARVIAATPAPLAKPDDEIRRVFDHLQELGWASPTIELLRHELALGERFTSAAPDSVTTTVKTINREELIVKYRPHAMTPNHFEAWEKSHTRSPSLFTPPPREV